MELDRLSLYALFTTGGCLFLSIRQPIYITDDAVATHGSQPRVRFVPSGERRSIGGLFTCCQHIQLSSCVAWWLATDTGACQLLRRGESPPR
ncbi:hypothetical protein BV25DRAFT_367113 [Artomyces pyxidatus]|uniref:Uncharacterized protein n=1 Tax=Artomyces pyxidatus TaxID=48021 RepID=A0ACB8T6V0_9AGAM|nr:hypothetical protein BV25DRAFT_367113 [Artomyces pyxidatus]